MIQGGGTVSSTAWRRRRPDFVLEPRCWDTVLKYITAGGNPSNLTRDYEAEREFPALREFKNKRVHWPARLR